MPMSYFLPRSEVNFSSQTDFKNYLNSMRRKYEAMPLKVISEPFERNVLLDFIENFHNDREMITEQFNLDNCEFYVDVSPNYSQTKCFYLRDKDNVEHKRQFSVTVFSAPSDRTNLAKRCSYLISELKLNIKCRKLPTETNLERFDLCHKTPKFKDCIDGFIEQYDLVDKLGIILSKNGSGNNVPIFTEGNEDLDQKFLQFYQSIYVSDEQYEIRENPRAT